MTTSKDPHPGGSNPQASGPVGWYFGRYLPHFDSNDVVQHVTLHLADSLPKDALQRMEEALNTIDPQKRDIERRRRLEAIADAGHGCCILRHPEVAAMVQSALLYFNNERYHMFAWVIMPNHVHTLFQTINDWKMKEVISSWKSWTGKQICENAAWGYQSPQETRHHRGWRSREKQVWHSDYWDRYIRDEKHFADATEYIHQNPVKAGLVRNPDDWPWSSAYSPGTPPCGTAG